MAAKMFGDLWHRFCDGCSSQFEIEMDASDLGISQSDANVFSRARPNAGQKTIEMAALLGLTGRDVQKEHWRAVDVARACAQCKSSKACGKFLDGNDNGFMIESCPNFERFSELANEKFST